MNMQEAKGCPTPMVSASRLSKHDGNPTVEGKIYRSAVGALQYATITRPEISFCVSKVSQFMANPLDSHWKAVKRILRYLAGSSDYGLHILPSSFSLTGFSDSDWGADLDDRRSITGYCVYFGKTLISWCSKKQTVVSRSSTEAEYRSLAQVTCELSWLKSLHEELKIKYLKPPTVWVDNISTISLASNPVLHSRTKQIELDVHFVRDKVHGGEIDLRHVPTTIKSQTSSLNRSAINSSRD
ncbi:secreted RxLR effector protein 161-like [Salvia hispanica]|uniref:secreted RxLR effector protein 161-like n=1 Tax=Salvia hispanica TaxID=49212 RepID=UPI0020097027|nr:secreted RxLR effector protein 161-like [Salvia hispanica]